MKAKDLYCTKKIHEFICKDTVQSIKKSLLGEIQPTVSLFTVYENQVNSIANLLKYIENEQPFIETNYTK
mgnify:CR=1 FL=1